MTETGKSNRDTGGTSIEILVLAASGAFARWSEQIRKAASGPVADDDFPEGVQVSLASGATPSVRLYRDPGDFVERFRNAPVGASLIDCREDDPGNTFMETMAGKVLPSLMAGSGFGRMPARRSIMVILPEDSSTAHHAYAVGTLQLGGVYVEPGSLLDVLESAYRIARPDDPGKIAICLAGGGIEGMFYELGVLRALNAHLKNKSITDFDIFSGISAGAVLCAFLANGVEPSEIADALHGRDSRIAPVTRSILFDPNLGEVARRLIGAVADIMRGNWLTKPIDTAMKVTPTALFSGDKLRVYLERELDKRGLVNEFDKLEKKLFVGVTDQDSGVHVSFGTLGLNDPTISRAVRASTAMTPYYAPEKIGDRYFVDGIFTRTIDLDVAVAHGARLVICIDPMTPVQVEEAGYVSERGGFFNTVQSVKSMIRTRLSEVIDRAEEAYPDLKVLVFSPTPHDLEKMSGTLMRFFNRTETEEMAYESTRQRIIRDFDWLKADLERYGFELSKTPSRPSPEIGEGEDDGGRL